MAFIFSLPRIDENTPKETLISYLKQMNEQLTYAMNLLDDRTVALSSAIGVDENTIESGSALIKKINMCANEIDINASKLGIDGTELVGRINLSAENIGIDAGKVNIAGETKINEVFSVGTDGKISMKNCNLQVDTSSSTQDAIKLNYKNIIGGVTYNYANESTVGRNIITNEETDSRCEQRAEGLIVYKNSTNESKFRATNGNLIVSGNSALSGDATVSGKLWAKGNATVSGLLEVNNKLDVGSGGAVVNGSTVITTGQIRLGASGWTDSSKMPLVSFYDDNVGGWRHLASVSKRSDGNYRMQFGVTSSSLDNSAKGYIDIGHETYTNDISINAKNNIEVTGNLVLKGSTRGTFDITTSNQTLKTFSASNGGQTWLLNLNNSSNGASTYLVSIANSGVALTKIAENVSGVTPTLSVNASNQFQIIVKGNASVTVNYSWTRIF